MLKFSIVINTYNRATLLDDAIHGLSELDYQDFEIIVVNGPSTDNTSAVLAKWAGRIKHGDCPEANLSKARNVGIEMAGGDVICFIDDDAVPHPKWLDELAVHYGDPAVGAVGGFTIDNTGVRYQAKKTLCDRFGNAFFPNDLFDERPLCFPGSPIYPSLLGTNSSFRASALREIGGFDPVFAYLLDETDVCLRLMDRGFKVVYEPDALVFHQFAPSHIRSNSRIPKTLYPSAVSKSYFISTHGAAFSERRANAELVKYEEEIMRANRWLHDHGDIDGAHRVSLDDDLLAGIKVGKRLALEARVLRKEPRCVKAPEGDGAYLPATRKHGLRIALVSRNFPPSGEAGIARWTAMMARGLADLGHKIHVVTHAAAEPYTRFQNGYWVHAVVEEAAEESRLAATRKRVPDGLVGWCAAVYSTVQVLKTFGLNVVSFPIWDVEGMMLADDESLGVVMSLHTSYALARPFKPEWNMRPLFGHFHVDKVIAAEKHMLERVPHLLANSKAIVEDVETAYDVDIQMKSVLAPHGTFEPICTTPAEIREKANGRRQHSAFRIAYVGRFEPRKGFDLACDAFRRVLDSVDDVEIRIVGDTLDDSARAKIRFLGAGRLLDDRRVRFLGSISRRDLDEVYFESDVVVMPSRYESFGLVAIEAMAAGTPVIALASGGLAEVVRDGVTGFAIAPGVVDGKEIADRLEHLNANPEILRQMKSAARCEFESVYTVEAMARSAEPIYYAAARREP